MSEVEKRTIQGLAKNVRTLLGGVKYSIDFYQREYKWETKQVDELIDDLTSRFLEDHNDSDEREAVANYGHYFLGSIVISHKGGKLFIIDGQQRLTTLTLLLIYLHNIQAESENKVGITEMIFSEKFGKKSFNLDVPERTHCMEALFIEIPFDTTETPESICNIVGRYQDIGRHLPEDITDEALPYFIDWLIENVYLVEITAYSDDDAYRIFETMNDRGLSLTATDMLKGYLLANIDSDEKRQEALAIWKKHINELAELGPEDTADFFKAWLRSQYAESIRERKKGAKAQDFERLGTEFHRWIRDHKENIGLKRNDDFFGFIKRDMDFFARQYKLICQASKSYTSPFEDIFHIANYGFTLQYPVLLSPLRPEDNEEIIQRKLRLVAAYIDILLARRLWNWHSISYSTMQYAMFLVMREIRGLQPEDLVDQLRKRLNEMEETFVNNDRFSMHQKNNYMVHRLLARMTDTLERGAGLPSHYLEYINIVGDPRNFYEVEHVWSYHPEQNTDEFDNPYEFNYYRNRIGGLLLLPKKFNASYNDLPYEEKLEHYFGQNLLAQSLNPKCYKLNPGFLGFITKSELPFQAHTHFKKADLDARQKLYNLLAEYTWNPARLDEAFA